MGRAGGKHLSGPGGPGPRGQGRSAGLHIFCGRPMTDASLCQCFRKALVGYLFGTHGSAWTTKTCCRHNKVPERLFEPGCSQLGPPQQGMGVGAPLPETDRPVSPVPVLSIRPSMDIISVVAFSADVETSGMWGRKYDTARYYINTDQLGWVIWRSGKWATREVRT